MAWYLGTGSTESGTQARTEVSEVVLDTGEVSRAPAAAQRELMAALLAADEPALRRLVAEDCQIIGPKGFQLSKSEWISAHVDDVYELRSIDNRETRIDFYGDTAVIVGLQDSACIFRGKQIDGLFRTLSVWHHHLEVADWQLVALQYTAVSEAAR
jgi:Domain of unknown function (DUF4440)